MQLSSDDVRHLADLARIELSDEALESFVPELESILEYVSRLSAVDTHEISDTFNQGLSEVDPDKARLFNERAALIANFPDHVGDILRVPAVFYKPKE